MPELPPAVLSPVAPAVIQVAAAHGYTIEELVRALGTPEANAILTTLEQRAAELINGLPSYKDVTLDAATGKSVATPGWKTSEFWCLVVFFLLALFTMLAGVLPPQWALACQALSVGLYQISRGLAKRGTGN